MSSRPQDWSPVGLDEDPTPGEPETVDALSSELKSVAEWMWRRAMAWTDVLNRVGEPNWSGLAAEVFRERLQAVIDAAHTASTRHSEGADATWAWVVAMCDTQAAADAALQQAKHAQEDLALAEASVGMLTAEHAALLNAVTAAQKAHSNVPAGSDLIARRQQEQKALAELAAAKRLVEDAQQRLDDARTKARTAKDAYDTAARVFINALQATLHGAIAHATAPELSTFTSTMGTLTGVKAGVDIESEFMNLLTQLTPEQVRKLLAEDPDLVQQFWDNPPDPEAVASWWKTLPDAVREAWCQDAPQIIGNLPGLDADTRIHANAIQFQRDLNDPTIDPDSPRGKVLRDILKALNVAKIYGPGLDYEALAKANIPPRGLLDYNLRHDPPLAAVAIGETSAERSGKVTWMIPGMANKLGDKDSTLTGWTNGAINLYNEQQQMEDGPHMVVAWIGYDPPALLPDTSVFAGDRARAGAARLSQELDGQYAADRILGGNPHPFTSVVGHSYGTVVAANAAALLHHDLQSVVFVASAGIERHIPDASFLNVEGGPQHVYTTESSKDGVAGLGRLGSARADPRDSSFGGRVYSSEGDLAHHLEPTDGHDATGSGSDNGDVLHPHATSGHGYFDQGTEAVHNTAAAATGIDGQINGGAGRPWMGTDR